MQEGCINGHHHGTAQSLNQSDIVHGSRDMKTVKNRPAAKIGNNKVFKNQQDNLDILYLKISLFILFINLFSHINFQRTRDSYYLQTVEHLNREILGWQLER